MSTWFVRSAASGSATGVDWTNAVTTLAAVPALGGYAVGDTVFVADDHSDTTGLTTAASFGISATALTNIICVDHTKASPGVNDVMTGAYCGIAGNFALKGTVYVDGLFFESGLGATGNMSFTTSNSSGSVRFKNCTFKLSGTSSGQINMTTHLEFEACKFVFTQTFHFISFTSNNGKVRWRNSPWANTITAPSNMQSKLFSWAPSLILEGVNLSGWSGNTGAVVFLASGVSTTIGIKDCVLPTTTLLNQSNAVSNDSWLLTVINSDSSGAANRNEVWRSSGSMLTETVLVRTGGAGISWNFTTFGVTSWVFPFTGLTLAEYNSTAGSSVNVTIQGIADPRYFSAVPNNDEFWMDVTCPGNGLGKWKTGTKANILAANTALTASTQAWDSLVTARGNSTSYNLGDKIKLASNPGRVWFCTTAGTSAGSEPGGYAGGTDGSAITDSSAVFTAGYRFKQTLAVTPTFAGTISAYPRLGKNGSTVYIDPILVLS